MEDELYKIPKHRFEREHGNIFQTMFSLPQTKSGAGVEGSSDDHPIILNGVLKADWDVFLKLLYPT